MIYDPTQDPAIMIAYKEGSALYLNVWSQQLMRIDLVQDGLRHEPFNGDYWALDLTIGTEGFTTIDDVLVEPVEGRLIISESKISKCVTTVGKLVETVKKGNPKN